MGQYYLVLILYTGCAAVSWEEKCLNEVDVEYCGKRELCEGKIELQDILTQDIGEDNIFFIETSPKEVITPREACSLESAAGNSGLHVVMVRTGKVLDMSDNTTCHIVNMFKEDISIYNIDPVKFAENTPIEGFFTSDKLKESMSRYDIVHYRIIMTASTGMYTVLMP